MSDADVDGVDAWIQGYKVLDGYQPQWLPSTGRTDWKSTWPIQDASGVLSGKLCLECDNGFKEVSLSVIMRSAPIFRLDWVPADRKEGNPYAAQQYANHLPANFLGTHVHAWKDHREYVRANGLKGFDLPFRRPLVAPSTIDEALEHVAGEVTLTVLSSQRGITLPPQSGLNLDWKKGRKK